MSCRYLTSDRFLNCNDSLRLFTGRQMKYAFKFKSHGTRVGTFSFAYSNVFTFYILFQRCLSLQSSNSSSLLDQRQSDVSFTSNVYPGSHQWRESLSVATVSPVVCNSQHFSRSASAFHCNSQIWSVFVRTKGHSFITYAPERGTGVKRHAYAYVFLS